MNDPYPNFLVDESFFQTIENVNKQSIMSYNLLWEDP